MKATLVALLLILPAAAPAGAAPARGDIPTLLSWSEQMEERDRWLEKRHTMLLGMMRRHDLDWWIVVNEEFHDDPLTPYVAPARPYAGNRDIFVFIDADEAGLRKVAVTGYAEESVGTFFESARS